MKLAAGASTSPEPGSFIANLPGTNGIHGRATTTTQTVRARTSAPAVSPRKVIMLCPVCMQPFETDAQRTVQRHEDSMGNTCPLSGRVGPDWDERSTRAAVPGRSGGSCEYCALARAQDMAHRRATGVGGRWSPANVLHLCRRCHRRAHDYPQWAHAVGLRLKQGENPEKRLVTRENGTAFQPTDEIAMPRSKGR